MSLYTVFPFLVMLATFTLKWNIEAVAGWLACRFSASFSNAECIAINISNGSYSWCLLAVYRPPSENVNLFIQDLHSVLSDLFADRQLCIIGDVNIDIENQKKSRVENYSNTLALFGIESTTDIHTREEFLNGNFVSSCIGHINIRASNYLINSAVITYNLADHYFTACQCMPSGCNSYTNPVRSCITITD